MPKTWIIVLSVFVAAGVILGLLFISLTSGSPKDTGKDLVTDNSQIVNPTTNSPMPTAAAPAISAPAMSLDPQLEYTAVMTTSAGKITIHLNADQTPVTVNNFVYLSKKGFYDNTIFHRVIKGFMIQGGDPNGDGTGGPGYSFADEPFTGNYSRGTLAMANAGPNTNGSQFFIIQDDTNLPKNYVIFGKVLTGLDVVDKIADASVSANLSGEFSKPDSPVKILTITIQTKKLPPVKPSPKPTQEASPSATPNPT
jgi:peptidylprolyl isomerase